jgi:predicted ferric reductase
MKTTIHPITTQPTRRSNRLAPAPHTRAIDSDVFLVLAFSVLVITGIWAVNGGWDEVSGGLSHFWRASASVSGIWTTMAALVGLILAARVPWMERSLGLDRVLIWHRIAGDTMGILLGVHVFTSLMAEMSLRGGLWNTIRDMTGREPYMGWASIGSLIVAVVVVSSWKSVRNRLSYETWYLLHLTAYVGIIISYSHQITLGSLLSGDRLIRFLWGILFVYVIVLVVLARWSAVFASIRRPLRVLNVQQETHDTVSVVIGGPNIKNFSGEAGQFIMVRMLKSGTWWKNNPYSLSAAPTIDGMRITVKDRGDASAALFTLRKGDRVAVEGPYGIATPEIFDGARPLFIAGGVGVTPVRAMLESLPSNSRPLVLLRARTVEEIPHYKEICELTENRGGEIRLVLGRTAQLKVRDPFTPKILTALVPDLYRCVAFVCGPTALTFAARKGLKEAGLDSSRIHLEKPWW